MKAKLYLPLLFGICLATLNLNAANWQVDFNIHENLVVDEIINFNDHIIVVSHYTLPADTMLLDAPTFYSYHISKFDELGIQLTSTTFETALNYKGYVLNNNNEIITFWQDFYPLTYNNGLHIYKLNSDLETTLEKSIRFNDVSTFNSFYFYNDKFYAAGHSQISGLVTLLSFNNQFELNWLKEFSEYQIVSYGSLAEVTANQNGIYLVYNSNELPVVADGNLDYSSVLIQLNEEGVINWAKNIHYEPYYWAYFGNFTYQFVKTSEAYVWTIGSVSPACDEGCPYNVLNQIDAAGNIVAAKKIQANFYSNLNQGLTLSNGNIILYGTGSGDYFGGDEVFIKSSIVEYNSELQAENTFKANEINSLGFGETYTAVFPNAVALDNEEIAYYWEGKIYRTSLAIDECNNLEADELSTANEQGWSENSVDYQLNELTVNDNSLSEFAQASNLLNHQRTCISNKDTVNAIINTDDVFFNVYPNPVLNELNIIGELSNNFMVNIYNLNGKLLITSINQMKLDVSDLLSKGIFITELSYNGNFYYKKLIKQ